ncbi:MAG: hypothetical protein ACFCVD_22005 [Nodosilinea sp.]
MHSPDLSYSFESNESSLDLSSMLLGNFSISGLAGIDSSFRGSNAIAEVVERASMVTDFSDISSFVISDSLSFLSDENISLEEQGITTDLLGTLSGDVNSNAAIWDSVSKTADVLSEATHAAVNILADFLNDSSYFEKSKVAFGEQISLDELTTFIREIISGSADIAVEIVDGGSPISSGAFAAETNTIYFSETFLEQHKSNVDNVANVLVEEWGHYLDNVLNASDSYGDEGEIFLSLVRGFNFDLDSVRAEDDHISLEINGSDVVLEQASGVINLPTSWVVFRSVRGSILAFKRDGTISALTDIYFFSNGVERRFENVQSRFDFFGNRQFVVSTFVSNTRNQINPDGTIGFRPGFIQPRLTINAPLWTRIS